jgi:hypothetical protein
MRTGVGLVDFSAADEVMIGATTTDKTEKRASANQHVLLIGFPL